MNPEAVAFLRGAEIGTRVVVRTRIPGGFTDALGPLRSRAEESCTVETRRRGVVTVAFADVVAAKAVPDPPARRVTRVR